jgi:hypothetical protein
MWWEESLRPHGLCKSRETQISRNVSAHLRISAEYSCCRVDTRVGVVSTATVSSAVPPTWPHKSISHLQRPHSSMAASNPRHHLPDAHLNSTFASRLLRRPPERMTTHGHHSACALRLKKKNVGSRRVTVPPMSIN